MLVKIEIDRSTPEFKKNNIVSKINSLNGKNKYLIINGWNYE